LTEVAKSLGIASKMIYIWHKKYTPKGDKTKLAQQYEMRADCEGGLWKLKRKTTFKKNVGLLRGNQK